MLAVVFSQRNYRVLCALIALGVAELAAVPPSDRCTVKEVRALKHSSEPQRLCGVTVDFLAL